jgi:hypothetical protein
MNLRRTGYQASGTNLGAIILDYVRVLEVVITVFNIVFRSSYVFMVWPLRVR